MRSLACRILALLLVTQAAQADWLEVSSDHFVVYGTQGEKTLHQFAERLELYHAAMAQVLRLPPAKPSPSNRVTIFIIDIDNEVQRLAKSDNSNLKGIYIPKAGGTVALVTRLQPASSDYGASAETILFHEYAHHVQASMTARTFPSWFVEGFAEFFANVKFLRNGDVGVGAPATHRAYELAYTKKVPIRSLLEFDGGTSTAGSRYVSFYGQSWVLFHYLQFSPERSGQLERYQALLASGQTALDAATGAFGDLDQLEKDMESYQSRRALSYAVISRDALSIGPIVARSLRPGEQAMMPVMIQSKVGVSLEEALELLPQAQNVASRFPDDPAVLAALAEAEYDADNDDAAIAAADRALAIDPGLINAHLQKGFALYNKVNTGALPKEDWKVVRAQFVKANKVENDHPIPLARYYQTFLEQGEPPTKAAVDGLEWAMALAPFDGNIRWTVAHQMIRDERLHEAAQTLAPLAYSPHPGEDTAEALALLKDIEGRIAAAQAAAAN